MLLYRGHESASKSRESTPTTFLMIFYISLSSVHSYFLLQSVSPAVHRNFCNVNHYQQVTWAGRCIWRLEWNTVIGRSRETLTAFIPTIHGTSLCGISIKHKKKIVARINLGWVPFTIGSEYTIFVIDRMTFQLYVTYNEPKILKLFLYVWLWFM